MRWMGLIGMVAVLGGKPSHQSEPFKRSGPPDAMSERELRWKQLENPGDMNTYLQLIRHYGSRAKYGDAIGVLGLMQRHNRTPSRAIFAALLREVSTAGNYDLLRQVLRVMAWHGHDHTTGTVNSLINTAIQAQDLEVAVGLFNEMRATDAHCRPNRETFTLMVKAFIQNDKPDKALTVVEVMENRYNLTFTRKSLGALSGLKLDGNSFQRLNRSASKFVHDLHRRRPRFTQIPKRLTVADMVCASIAAQSASIAAGSKAATPHRY